MQPSRMDPKFPQTFRTAAHVWLLEASREMGDVGRELLKKYKDAGDVVIAVHVKEQCLRVYGFADEKFDIIHEQQIVSAETPTETQRWRSGPIIPGSGIGFAR